MFVLARQIKDRLTEIARCSLGLGLALVTLVPMDAQALPIFARQTGQNCVACHAGGQFPELTPYGRMFKLTGYTLGERTLPFAVMGVANVAKISSTSGSADPGVDFYRNNSLHTVGGSLFIGGKITDNIGLFSQITYDNYNRQGDDGKWHGHSGADNVDLRFADRYVDNDRDLIFGLSVNNNPSVTDVWNTAPAWSQYVPTSGFTSAQFADGVATPYPGFAAPSPVAGFNAYAYWNKTVYAELGFYRTAKGAFNILSRGENSDPTALAQLKGSNNPYWRLALTREWGAHNLMVGTSGMTTHMYDPGTDGVDPGDLGYYRNTGIDAQYQYLLNPHTVTATIAYMRQVQDLSPNFIGAAEPDHNAWKTNVFRSKLTYVYNAKYGGSLAYFNRTGTSDAAMVDLTPITGNALGSPGIRGMTGEVFWLPIQYVRVGLQYTLYNKYNGASSNYDGNGRNASDNNTLLGYLWFAY